MNQSDCLRVTIYVQIFQFILWSLSVIQKRWIVDIWVMKTTLIGLQSFRSIWTCWEVRIEHIRCVSVTHVRVWCHTPHSLCLFLFLKLFSLDCKVNLLLNKIPPSKTCYRLESCVHNLQPLWVAMIYLFSLINIGVPNLPYFFILNRSDNIFQFMPWMEEKHCLEYGILSIKPCPTLSNIIKWKRFFTSHMNN